MAESRNNPPSRRPAPQKPDAQQPDRADEAEICAGCGADAPQHPMVGVTFKESDDGNPVAHPICAKCHQQPPRALGMHFFPRSMKRQALALAGSTNLGQ